MSQPKAFFRGVWRAVLMVAMIAAATVAIAGGLVVLVGAGVTLVGFCLLTQVKSWAWV